MNSTLQELFTGIEITDASPQSWSVAFETWVSSKAKNTQRAYRQAWNDFIASAGDEPWAVGASAVQTWLAAMRERDLADSTISQRLAAVSSFYRFACERYTLADQQTLHNFNPALTVERSKVAPYRQAVYLTLQQVKAFLEAISLDKPQGLRNYALFLMYIATGRRNAEVRTLTWGDFRPSTVAQDEKTIYQYYWKGKGKQGWDECPASVMQAIEAYLRAVDRWEGLQAGDYIFTALTSSARLFPHVDEFEPFKQPLSASEVRRQLHKYAKKAGIDVAYLTVHSLRHTNAMLLKTVARADLSRIQERLGHSSSKTTENYLHALEGGSNPEWRTIEEALGL
jgi:site-specific recombinase XerD